MAFESERQKILWYSIGVSIASNEINGRSIAKWQVSGGIIGGKL